MIPLYRAPRAERAANILLRHFRHVRIDCAYTNVTKGVDRRVRFRADDVNAGMVYFAKVPSQVKRWRDNGGGIICWTWRNDLECDAMLFTEAPKRMEALRPATLNVGVVAVIYEPPSWLHYAEVIAARHGAHPSKLRRLQRSLNIMQDYVAGLPIFTDRVAARLSARQAQSRSSSLSSPGSPAGGERSAGMTG